MTTRRDDGIEKHMVDEGVLQEDNLPVFANISVPSVVPKDDAASNSSEQLPNELAESRYTGVSVWRREYKKDCPPIEFTAETSTIPTSRSQFIGKTNMVLAVVFLVLRLSKIITSINVVY